ncbi:MAG: serine hydrolase [Chloroflexi bacterium]|nr:serine hydrolase [Chloroflexota bacterium]
MTTNEMARTRRPETSGSLRAGARATGLLGVLVAAGLAAAGCAAAPPTANAAMQAKLLYQEPLLTDDGWATASLNEVGMSAEPVEALLSTLAMENGRDVNGLLVVKDGRLVLEAYYPGEDVTVEDDLTFTYKEFDRDTLHCLASVSKSVTSLLFGIAVDRGNIADLDEPVSATFPEYPQWQDDLKGQVTLRQLLSMTAGLDWDEDSYSYDDPRNDFHRMFDGLDPIGYLLEKPVVAKPGTAFLYSSGVTNLLGEAVSRKVGMPLAEYARIHLFSPLGITSYDWRTFPHSPEMAVAGGLLYLRPRDMAKIGQMVLQQGAWDGRQIISQAWIEESTAEAEPVSMDLGPGLQPSGYGYQWWRGTLATGETEAIYAAGWRGQFIFILPRVHTVIVLTGSDSTVTYAGILDLVNRHILASILGLPIAAADFGVTLSVPTDPGKVVEIHGGPGKDYPAVGQLEPGAVISIQGRNDELGLDAMWLQIPPNGWIWLEDVGPAGWLRGNLANLPVVGAP